MKTTHIFKVEDPCSMAVTHNGNILVSIRNEPKITSYTSTGTIVQTVTTKQCLQHISACRITGNVAISCYECGVFVMNDKLQPMFTYPTSGDKIYAWDTTFDSAEHLLIADNYHKTSFINF